MIVRTIPTILAALGLGVVLLLPAKAGAAEAIALDAIGTTCLMTELDECKVLTAGYLNIAEFGDDDGTPLLAWQTQLGTTVGDGIIGGFVLFQHNDQGWSKLDAGFDGFFQPPSLNNDRLLHVAGYSQGTGAYNTDRLYRWTDDGSFAAIDMTNWLTNIALPGHLGIWKGVAYDFANPWAGYVARTALWHDSDGNCCPSGGSAVISLEIENNALVATGQTITPPAKTK